jgi:hypothetical protein
MFFANLRNLAVKKSITPIPFLINRCLIVAAVATERAPKIIWIFNNEK